MQQSIDVAGMTCGNCVRHVTAALAEIPGVSDVHVDLASNHAVFTVAQPIDREVLVRALDEAGYTLA
ncbi:MAG: heavy-metal-associated domain-containing protein [Vulcanimicrobiaceae bacterium]